MQPQLIAGRYQVLRAIGHGGMGTVWLCRDEILGREVAVKQIGALPGDSANETRRAMREARSAAALNHPNAVAVYDVVDHDGRPWLVMEYVAGQTLADEISRDGQLSPQRVADIGAQLASALARAHERRIVHRDIKPGNVLIDRAGRPKISDFGIARGHGDDQLTQTGFVTGTPGYLSPELARGGDPDSASDVWALGATLYSAVEGRSPYASQSNPIAVLRAIATERPRPMMRAGALAPAIETMMHEDPARRWDMATSARRLGGIATGLATGLATTVMPQVDPASSQVNAVPPVETPQSLEATQRSQAAVPPVETPQPLEATQRSQAAVHSVEPTQRLESVRPVPAPAEPAPLESARPREVHGGAGAPPSHRSSGRRRIPLLLLALLVAVLGAAVLVDQFGDQGNTAAAPGSAVATASAKPTVTRAPTTAEQPVATTPAPTTAEQPVATTPAPTTTEPPVVTNPAPSSSTPEPDPDADKELESFVESYYSDVTKNTDRTWAQLSPTMQGAAGGRAGYDGFWSTIRDVRVNKTTADASTNTAVANLTFTNRRGAKSTENHRFTFIKNGDSFLIESDRLD